MSSRRCGSASRSASGKRTSTATSATATPKPGRRRRRAAPVVTFLSDYGTTDEFVGVVHSVVLSICPSARLVALTHDIPAHDVRAGSDVLVRSAPYLAPGVVLAVVDPGVGGSRRRIVLECGRHSLVGPDNGLLPPLADALGGVRAAREATRPEYWWAGGAGPEGEGLARTFDGRDVFGPVAAHLAAGVAAGRIGRPIDAAGLVRLPPPPAGSSVDRGPGWIACVVADVDRFGNVALAAELRDLDELGDGPLQVRAVGHVPIRLHRVATFAELSENGLDRDRLGLLVDSSGRPALVADRSSAAARLAVGPGDRIEIAAVDWGAS